MSIVCIICRQQIQIQIQIRLTLQGGVMGGGGQEEKSLEVIGLHPGFFIKKIQPKGRPPRGGDGGLINN